ncbi:MAG: hypothetical protein JW739_00415 [Opitutales bacterium]|nr:hypothetical protein [Opitutales bacterium]
MSKEEFYSQVDSSVSGEIKCSTAAPAFGCDAGQAIFIALTNPNIDRSVSYAVYDQVTSHCIDSGSIGKGGSKSVIVPAADTPHVIRIQNQSSCDLNKITPKLSFYAAIQ